MNMNGLINRLIRQVLNRALYKGVDMGMDHMARGKNGGKPLSKEQQRASREMAQRTKKTMRMARRIGRF